MVLELALVLGSVVLELVLELGSEVLALAQVLGLGSEVREALAHVVRNEEREVCGVASRVRRSRMLVQYRLCTCLHGRYHS